MIRRGRTGRAAAVQGRCDGVEGEALYGWAWRPDAPHVPVEVEQWVDGVLAARALADLHRGDLEAAGVGNGRCAWRMPLALDPARAGAQHVEVRVRGGGLLPDGAWDLTYAPPPGEPGEASAPDAAWGVCDGRDGDALFGWAWRPAFPEHHVEVEQWVDGLLAARSVANLLRADLHAAAVGHARYGWRMRLALDPSKSGPQAVELRIRGGGLLAGGRFSLRLDELPAAAGETAAEARRETGVVGRCDGLKGGELHGWAWDPLEPRRPVQVELWIEGDLAAAAAADEFRPDLRANRIGDGRHGWRLPVDPGRLGPAPLRAEVRSRGGPPLTDGVLQLRNDLSLDDPANAALRPFVAAVLEPGPAPAKAPARAPVAWLLYCPEPDPPGPFQARQYDDYRGAMQAFAPAVARLGETVAVQSLAEAEAVWAARRSRGDACVLLCFAPPRQAPLHVPCPVVPVFGWAFPTIPTGLWDGDARSDWRAVLRLAGRAVTFSRFAAEAVRAAMGADFPVAAIPPPVVAEPAAEAPWRRRIALRGVVFDSRDYVFDPEATGMPPPIWPGDAAAGADRRSVEIEGVLFTACLDFADGRTSWGDLVSAFATAHRENPRAVLLLKLAEPNAAWMEQLYRHLAALPRFDCRILAVRGPMEDDELKGLIAATHWFATACNAEALALPLQRFLAAGRPAIAPAHTALADLLDASCALVVDSDEEAWRWPETAVEEGWSFTQHPDDVGPTTRHRVSWSSLARAFAEAWRIAAEAPAEYARFCAAARERASAASGEGAAAALQALLAQDWRPQAPAPSPSRLLRELAQG